MDFVKQHPEPGVPPPDALTAGLYVHFPFCVHKCGYCDFNSWGETSRPPQERWLAALERQIRHWSRQLKSRGGAIDTVFFGGGTPSLLENDLLVESGRLIREHFPLVPDFEWTMECNPETLSPEKITALTRAGANRLSVGVQSFRNHHLDRLERHARREDNLRALEVLREHWRGRWSLDLMFGLPGQSFDEWNEDLATALSFEPDHISAYQLTLTTERSKNWSQPPEDDLLEMFDATEKIMAAAGLEKYETSNFAKPDHESRHNLRYWRLRSFIGLGPGASGLISGRLLGQPGNRWGAHQKNPDRFELWSERAGDPDQETRSLTPRDAKSHLFEMLMMGLRLREGLEVARLGSLSEPFLACAQNPQLIELLEKKNNRWFPTERGSRQLDTLLARLFLDLEKLASGNLDSWNIDPNF